MSNKGYRGPEFKIHPTVKNNLRQILEGNGKLIVEVSQDIGKETSGRQGVSSSQVRKIFGDLKRRQYKKFNLDKIQLIRPKLAYTFARHAKRQRGLDLLLGTIDFLLEKVENKENFENVVNLFEAIIAYHKKFGGK
ncbi:hypothetical protein ES705_31706 [subsurface metagenome]